MKIPPFEFGSLRATTSSSKSLNDSNPSVQFPMKKRCELSLVARARIAPSNTAQESESGWARPPVAQISPVKQLSPRFGGGDVEMKRIVRRYRAVAELLLKYMNRLEVTTCFKLKRPIWDRDGTLARNLRDFSRNLHPKSLKACLKLFSPQ